MNSNNAERINEYRVYLSFSDFVEDDSRIYFANTNYNALTIVDKKTWTVEALLPFEGVERTAQNMHLRCVRAQNKICFLPAGVSCAHIYNMENGTLQTCSFPEETDVPQRSWEYCVYDGQVYLLPCTGCQGMWHWKVESDAMEQEDWWNISVGENALQHGMMGEEAFYTLEAETNRLHITDMQSKTVEFFPLPDEKVSHIVYDRDEQNFWYVMDGGSELVCWNKTEGVKKRYDLSVVAWWCGMYCVDGNVFLISTYGDKVCWLDKDRGILHCIHEVQCSRGAFFTEELSPSFKLIDGQLIYMLQNAGDIILINLETLEVTQHALEFGEDDKELQYTILLDRNALLFEDKGDIDLDCLIRYCGQREAVCSR